MSKSLSGIIAYVQRQARIDVSESIAIAGITEDSNDAIGIIASIRNWDELYRTLTLSLTSADGDTTYSLDPTVDKVELVRITLPVDYAKELIYVPRREVLAVLGAKSNNGTSTPNRWYYAEPSVSSSNVETKEMSFDYMPDRAYTVSYTFRRTAPQLVNPGDFPFFDGNYHHIVGYYDVWKYAERNPDQAMNPDYWKTLWEQGVRDLCAAYDSKVTVNAPIPGPRSINFY